MRWNVDPAAILTPQELESLKLAEELYSARGRMSAEQLGQVIGLDDDTRERFVGAVGLTLSNLDFEKRREVARKLDEASARFDEIIAIIGGTATEETAASEVIREPRTARELSPTQKTWLGRLYDGQGIDRIAAAGHQQRMVLADQLANIYMDLSIPRLNLNSKAERARQMKQLLGGEDIREMAVELGVSYNALYAGIMKAAESIQKRVPAIQLDRLLSDMESARVETADAAGDEPEEETEEDVAEKNELRPDQVRWLNRMMEDAPIEAIGGLNADQRDYLATRLSWRLSPALIKKYGKFGSDQRVDTMTRFINGEGILEIADSRRVTPEAIRQELIHAADRLKSTVAKEDLIQFVEEAQTFERAEE